jgi:hypothetical protein
MLFTTSHGFGKESGTAKTTKKKYPGDFIFEVFVVFVVHSPPYPKLL